MVDKVAAFTTAGALVGIASIIYMALLNIASPIIGCTSLSGGQGTVVGTLLGACIICVLANGLILFGLSDFMRQMITGVVIILAIIIDKYRERITAV